MPLPILGLNLGEQFSLPQCPKDPKSPMYDINIVKITLSCWGIPGEYIDRPDRIEKNNWLNIFMPIHDWPSYVIPSSLQVFLINKNVEGVTFDFSMLKFDEASNALINKYGKPTTRIERTVSNAFGAKFDSVSMVWKFSNGHVTLSTRANEIDKGSVIISTSEKESFEKSQKEATEKQGKPL